MVEITGTVIAIAIKDISKTNKVPRPATYLTLRVETTVPAEILEQLHSEGQRFTREPVAGIDDQLKVGERVTIGVSDVSYPTLLRIERLTRW